MQHALAQSAIPHPDSPFGCITCSFGIASAVPMPETQPLKLVAVADRALYDAKNAGRNRIARLTSLDALIE